MWWGSFGCIEGVPETVPPGVLQSVSTRRAVGWAA